MARNNNDYLKWEDIEKAVMDYYAGRVMSKYGSVRDCKLARSEVEGVLYELEYVPAADVEEVRHGEWLDRREEDCCTGEKPFVVGMLNGEPYASCFCSVCGEWLVASDEYPVKGNFCPNCGSHMDGKETK